MKKQLSGVAGAARLKNVNRAGLARAEKHGKRLDQTGKSRAINDVPPVTTTGLDLHALYDRHVAGAFVPGAKSTALHLLIQWPTELVDGKNAGYMLNHARAFAESVFGDEAIFADRLDRDETSQQVVDVFLAPRYIKTTKREAKPATSTTHHLKALAKKYGEKPVPFGYGRALQTALHEYMRDVMLLDGVERGKAKAVPGKDWKSAEQQRAEELGLREAQADLTRDLIERDREAVRADRAFADAEAQKVTDDRRALAEDRASFDRRNAELADRNQQVQQAEDAVRLAQAEVARQQDELTIAAVSTARATASAHEEEAAATRARVAAEADRALTARLVAHASGERDAIVSERARREAELALLMRASDDANGLCLRPVGTGIMMDETKMSPAEQGTFHRAWPGPVRLLALKLARALEQVRELTRRFIEREERLKADEAALRRREQANARELEQRRAAQRVEHEHALAALKIREDAVEGSAADAERRVTAADAHLRAALEKEKAATAIVALQEHWAKAVDMVGRYPLILIHNDDGSFRLDRRPERTGRLPDWLVTTLQLPAPAWAAATIRRLHQLDLAAERVEARERDAFRHLELLKDMINTAGPALKPAQQATVEQANRVIRQIGPAIYQRNQGRGM